MFSFCYLPLPTTFLTGKFVDLLVGIYVAREDQGCLFIYTMTDTNSYHQG